MTRVPLSAAASVMILASVTRASAQTLQHGQAIVGVTPEQVMAELVRRHRK